jgi:hypothetical protein
LKRYVECELLLKREKASCVLHFIVYSSVNP